MMFFEAPFIRAARRAVRQFSSAELVAAVIIPFVVHRLLLFCVVAFATQILEPQPVAWHALPGLPLLDPWLRFDSPYYLEIAVNGYTGEFENSTAPFFPLFPALIRCFALVLPLGIAALAVANLAALVAFCFIFLLLKDIASQDVARRAIWLAILFPTSFFLSAAYSESVYLMAIAGTALAWHRNKPGLAAIAVAAATLSRPVGLICATVPFVVGWLYRDRRLAKAPWFVLAAIPATLILFLLHFLATNDPTHFLHSATSVPLGGVDRDGTPGDSWTNWEYAKHWFAVFLDEGVGGNLMRRLLNWSAVALMVASIVSLYRRRHIELATFVLLSLAVPIAYRTGLFNLWSMGRYAVVAFPIFLTLSYWTSKGRNGQFVDAGFVMLQAALAILYGAWYWAE